MEFDSLLLTIQQELQGGNMIIDKTYGPQFDSIDGTVGKTQLVKRWAVVGKSGLMAFASQGRYTFETQQDAEIYLGDIKEVNGKDICDGMYVAAFWCWPGHFDPVGRANDCLDTPQDTSV
jgi:hypothetical protein